VVDHVLASTGRLEERRRLLPARVVLYYVIAMALYREAPYEEVMRHLLEGLAWQDRWATRWQVPTKAAIFKARARLGVEPVAELLHEVVRPLATGGMEGAWYRDRPVVTVDRLQLELAGGSEDDSPRKSAGSAGPSVLDLVGIIEGGTRVMLDVMAGPLAPTSLPSSAVGLAGADLTADDRAALASAGVDLVWEADPQQMSSELEVLPDGSRTVLVRDGTRPDVAAARLRLLKDGSPTEEGEGLGRVLLTTLMDPGADPAPELQRLYEQRTTLADCLDDLRVNPRSPTLDPRSRSAESALQEVYGVALAHYALQPLLPEPPPQQAGPDTGERP